jgi:hypothetical protein
MIVGVGGGWYGRLLIMPPTLPRSLFAEKCTCLRCEDGIRNASLYITNEVSKIAESESHYCSVPHSPLTRNTRRPQHRAYAHSAHVVSQANCLLSPRELPSHSNRGHSLPLAHSTKKEALDQPHHPQETGPDSIPTRP